MPREAPKRVEVGGGLGEVPKERDAVLQESALHRAGIAPETLAFNVGLLDTLKDPKKLFESKRAILKSFSEQIKSHLLAAKKIGIPEELHTDLQELMTELDSAEEDLDYKHLIGRRVHYHTLREGLAAQSNPDLHAALVCVLDALNICAVTSEDFRISDIDVAAQMTENQILETKGKNLTQWQRKKREDPIFRYSEDLTARENRMARVGVVALAGGVGILIGAAKLFSKDSDYTVPAMYLGVAAAAAIGEKKLKELPSGRELSEITFLGQKEFTNLQERYDIQGGDWAKIAQKMKDFEWQDGDPILAALNSGKELSEAQREVLSRKLGGSDSALDAKLKPLIGGRDTAPDGTVLQDPNSSHFLQLLGFFQKKMSDESWNWVKNTYITKGAGPKALRDFLRPRP